MYTTISVCFLLCVVAVGKCVADDTCYFNVNYKNGSNLTTCVQMNITASVQLLYHNKTTGFKSIMLPCNDTKKINTSGSTCNTTTKEAVLDLRWDDHGFESNLDFHFKGTSSEWNISEIVYTGYYEDLDEFNASVSNSIIGKPKKDNAYMCNSQNNLTLTTLDKSEDVNVTVHVALSNFKVKAFGFGLNVSNATYGTVSRCSQDIKGSKIVPIAVGAALAGLVVIVLVAYIIGRLRSRKQSSYEALS